MEFALRLNFKITNNKEKYESMIACIEMALSVMIKCSQRAIKYISLNSDDKMLLTSRLNTSH